jgi:hypothetical protein
LNLAGTWRDPFFALLVLNELEYGSLPLSQHWTNSAQLGVRIKFK